jgi:hypothetical protein
MRAMMRRMTKRRVPMEKVYSNTRYTITPPVISVYNKKY